MKKYECSWVYYDPQANLVFCTKEVQEAIDKYVARLMSNGSGEEEACQQAGWELTIFPQRVREYREIPVKKFNFYFDGAASTVVCKNGRHVRG